MGQDRQLGAQSDLMGFNPMRSFEGLEGAGEILQQSGRCPQVLLMAITLHVLVCSCTAPQHLDYVFASLLALPKGTLNLLASAHFKRLLPSDYHPKPGAHDHLETW